MLYFVIVFLLLLIVFILLRVKICIDFYLNGTKIDYNIKVFLFKGIVAFNLPKIRVDKNKIEVDYRKQRDKRIRFEQIKKIIEIIAVYKSRIFKIMKQFISKINIDEIKIKVVVGTGDAYYTSIFFGIIWSIFGVLFSSAMNFNKVSKKDIEIIPDFEKSKLIIHFYCIFSVKIVNIILVRSKLMYYYKKFKRHENKLKYKSNKNNFKNVA